MKTCISSGTKLLIICVYRELVSEVHINEGMVFQDLAMVDNARSLRKFFSKNI